ncbi:MAG: hypothetical protein LBH98_03205, partial [Chitinispirillales bacterium]|nr:hypothetical protein [Chitinispirillales bacterium]
STPKHILLYEAFGWAPPVFAHLPVILSEDGGKLSKRKGAASVMDYKNEGFLPDALRNFLALLGWNPGDDREIMSVREMIDAFDLSKVSPKSSIFDTKKLEWMNGRYLSKIPCETIYEEVKNEFFAIGANDKAKIISAINLMKERTHKITEIPALCVFFFNSPKNYDEQTLQKTKKNSDLKEILFELVRKLSLLENCNAETCDNLLQNTAAQFSVGFGKVGLPARLAITGMGGGPSLHDIIPIIGRDECVKRINDFLEKI